MHQGEYIAYLLDKYGLMDCNPVHLPLDAHHPFGGPDNSYSNVDNLHGRFCKLISELLYLTVCTCPDISYAINSLAQFDSKPTPAHFAAAKWLLCYLSGTQNLHVHYGGAHLMMAVGYIILAYKPETAIH